MELYVKQLLNGVYTDRKVSMFGDEEIELTKNWSDQQLLQGYGSWSKQFSLPIDYNNSEIFKYYNLIGGVLVNNTDTSVSSQVNPNYFMSARIIINDYEIIGNIQLNGFSMKQNVDYTYNVTFYGEEKNLIKILNNSDTPKMNDINLSGISFIFNKENVINTWSGTNTLHFVPLMATQKAINYRDSVQIGNINTSVMGTTSGLSMRDLAVSYNFKQILDKMFINSSISMSASTKVSSFLTNLYIMPNTKVEYGSDLTYIYTEAYGNYLKTVYGVEYNILKLTVGATTSTGILPGNQDLNSYHNITGYTTSDNYYTASSTGDYVFSLSFNLKVNSLPIEISPILNIIDIDTDETLLYAGIGLPGSYEYTLTLNTNQRIQLLVFYSYHVREQDEYGIRYEYDVNTYFTDNQISVTTKINKSSTASYDLEKSTIKFPDINVSDFFIHFCKSFNIFFIYDDNTKIIKLYFKDELPTTTYNLTQHLLLNQDYVFTNEPKAKLVDYLFAEGKDINNIAWKRSGPTALQYGQSKTYYKYDVGVDKLEYKSVFTVFPRTTLNKTDDENIIIENTEIPFHSELNESLSTINTDYLIFYKLPIRTGITLTYNLQDSYSGYSSMNYAPDYGPDGEYGHSLDYTKLQNVIKDNTSVKYEVEMDFLLPNEILYNIKVYDKVFIHGISYEISSININIKNGYTKLKLITTTNIFITKGVQIQDVYANFNNTITDIDIQTDNKIIFSGFFTTYNNINYSNLIRLNSDYSIDTSFVLGLGFSGSSAYRVENTSILNDGKLICSGYYQTYSGQTVKPIIRLNSNGYIDNTFTPSSNITNNSSVVKHMIVDNNKILVAGQAFTTTFLRLFRLNSDGSLDSTFDNYTYINNSITDFDIQNDSKIVIGGNLNVSGGVEILRLNSGGTLDSTFNKSTFNQTLYHINVLSDGKILVSGLFNTVSGFSYNNLVRLNSNGSIDTSFVIGAGFSESVVSYIKTSYVQTNGKILLGGRFDTYSGQTHKSMIRLNSDGSIDNSFNVGTGFISNTGVNGSVETINIDNNGNILVGGLFSSFRGVNVNNFVVLNPDGTIYSGVIPVTTTTTTTAPIGTTTTTTTTTIAPSEYYYTAREYDCSDCSYIGDIVNIVTYRNDIVKFKFYDDTISGNKWRIHESGSVGGQYLNLVGSGQSNCKPGFCI